MNTDYLNLLDRHLVTGNKTHKHRRAEKIYEDYFTALEDEDTDFMWDNYYEDIFFVDGEFLYEIGLEHYCEDFDWKSVYYGCVNCEDTTGHCDCYETSQKELNVKDSLMYNKLSKIKG